MIVKELYDTWGDGTKLFRTYSNEGKMIRKVGTDEMYSEAIDVKEYEYEETDELIEKIEDYGTDTDIKERG